MESFISLTNFDQLQNFPCGIVILVFIFVSFSGCFFLWSLKEVDVSFSSLYPNVCNIKALNEFQKSIQRINLNKERVKCFGTSQKMYKLSRETKIFKASIFKPRIDTIGQLVDSISTILIKKFYANKASL